MHGVVRSSGGKENNENEFLHKERGEESFCRKRGMRRRDGDGKTHFIFSLILNF